MQTSTLNVTSALKTPEKTQFKKIEPEPPSPPQPEEVMQANTELSIIDLLLRNRTAYRARLVSGNSKVVARALLIAIAVTTGGFGAALGFYRGGLQILFAGIKMPLVVLLTAGLITPVLSATARASRGRGEAAGSLREDVLLVLSTLAYGGLVLSALTPLVLLGKMAEVSYHKMILLVVGCCAIAGVVAIGFFLRTLRARSLTGWKTSALAAMMAFLIVGTQAAWVFRPYLVRPRSRNVPFIRAPEGGFTDSVNRSSRSARGMYDREAAPNPEGDAR